MSIQTVEKTGKGQPEGCCIDSNVLFIHFQAVDKSWGKYIYMYIGRIIMYAESGIGHLLNIHHNGQSEALIFHYFSKFDITNAVYMINDHCTMIYMGNILNTHFLDVFY